MATVQCLTAEAIQSRLEDLRINLLTLTSYLPIANEIYNFEGYKPKPNSVQDYGEEGAVNRDLENTFCPKGRREPISLKEAGPGLEAVAEVLDEWIERYPKSTVLQKWVEDLITASELATAVSSSYITTTTSTHRWIGFVAILREP